MRCPRSILLILLLSLSSGCGRSLPNAPTARDDRSGTIDRSRDALQHPIVAEVRDALGAVVTGEQVYLQRTGTFTDAADSEAIRDKLGVYLDEAIRRWAFSVSEASTTGFLATARGRAHTGAHGIVVTLRFERGQPIVWSVEGRRLVRAE